MKTDESLPILLRPMRHEDVNVVASAWLKSFRRSGHFNRGVPNRIYFRRHQKLLEALIPRTSLFIAVNEEDQDQVLGWICYEVFESVIYLHYLYVKFPFRRFGIATTLMEHVLDQEYRSKIYHSHSTIDFSAWKKKFQGFHFIYDPYVMFQTLEKDWYVYDYADERDPGPIRAEKEEEAVQHRTKLPKLVDVRRDVETHFRQRLRDDATDKRLLDK